MSKPKRQNKEDRNMIINQRSAKLRNGQTVREGDLVTFTDSDGLDRTYPIRRKRNGKLFFCNNSFPVTAYHSARMEKINE